MQELMAYLENKNIALVGNAKSIFDKTRDIDKHEVIIRLNKGTPNGKEAFIGKRTDVLAVSMDLTKIEIKGLFGDPKFLMYMTPHNRENLSWHLSNNASFYPKLNWRVLKRTLEARPSTGCMMFDFLWNYIEFSELHIYGFDFMKSPNWYTEKIHVGPHNYEAEEHYIRFTSRNDERIIIHD